MGRAKIQIKRIEDNTNRQVTFCKRRTGLMKKARELAVLCDADVAVLVVSSYGRVYSYASSKDMEQILQNARDKLRCGDGGDGNIATPPPQLLNNINGSSTHELQRNRESDQLELGLVKNELENLQKELRLRDGNVEELNRLSYKEVVELQDQMERNLRKINKHRLDICYQELESVKKRQKELELENDELRKHIQGENDSQGAARSVIDINVISGACNSSAESSPQLDSGDDLHGESFPDDSDLNEPLVELRLMN